MATHCSHRRRSASTVSSAAVTEAPSPRCRLWVPRSATASMREIQPPDRRTRSVVRRRGHNHSPKWTCSGLVATHSLRTARLALGERYAARPSIHRLNQPRVVGIRRSAAAWPPTGSLRHARRRAGSTFSRPQLVGEETRGRRNTAGRAPPLGLYLRGRRPRKACDTPTRKTESSKPEGTRGSRATELTIFRVRGGAARADTV